LLPRLTIESKACLQRFVPFGYQKDCINLVRRDFDYSTGNLEILLSGSYGSAKSILLAHLAVSHCLSNKRAHVAMVRRALPDIKSTIFREILEHIEGDSREENKEGLGYFLKEGRDYSANHTNATIQFSNGSEISSIYWADKRYKRSRSKSFSMILIEEGTENNQDDKEGFEEIKARLRRVKGVYENVLIVATNPDSPAHWLYDYFIQPNIHVQHPTRYVFYSRTEDNPYLDTMYIKGLRTNMDARRARRYLDGEWIEIGKDQIYYAYSTDNFVPETYEFDKDFPIHISWDFNIGVGKPLSAVLFQYIDDTFHFGREIVIEGMRTADSLDEMANRGLLDMECPYFVVNGDASGKHRDTRNRRDDYEIIVDFLSNYKTEAGKALKFKKVVPLSNPTLRLRHNKVNAYCKNAENNVRLLVYKDCPTLDKGFRLVELLKKAYYSEDDSKDYQHITTAAGYGIYAATVLMADRNQRTIQL